MLKPFAPRLDVLPDAQGRLWPELAQTPAYFTLYGGTAIALRLGHRQSADFDFFALTSSFEPRSLLEKLPYLNGAIVRQSAPNTLTVTVDRGGPVQLSFLGGLGLGQVAAAEPVEGPGFKVAALIDLSGMKAAGVTQRAEPRDYLDIHALMTKANISLADMLAAAACIYGPQFNPLLSLKAIAYHEDSALAELPNGVRHDLAVAVRATDPQALPAMHPVRKPYRMSRKSMPSRKRGWMPVFRKRTCANATMKSVSRSIRTGYALGRGHEISSLQQRPP